MQGWDPVAGEREMKFTGTEARPRTAAQQSSAHASHTRAARKLRLVAVSSEEIRRKRSGSHRP
eukprot:2456363-Pleurochrysis_carterae.AAC.1